MGNDKPKPRDDQIYTTTKPGTEQISILTNGQYVIFGDNVESGYCQQTYDRDNGKKKVVTQVHQQGDKQLFFDSDNAILQYSNILAVDTNTDAVHGQAISMVGVVSVDKKFAVDRNGIAYVEPTYAAVFCLEYVGVKPPMENFGWYYAMRHLVKNAEIRRYSRVGMIVDSETSVKNLSSEDCICRIT